VTVARGVACRHCQFYGQLILADHDAVMVRDERIVLSIMGLRDSVS